VEIVSWLDVQSGSLQLINTKYKNVKYVTSMNCKPRG